MEAVITSALVFSVVRGSLLATTTWNLGKSKGRKCAASGWAGDKAKDDPAHRAKTAGNVSLKIF